MQDSNFLINWVKLDAMESSSLLGFFKDSNEWRPGFLQQIIEEMLLLKGPENVLKRELVEFNHQTKYQIIYKGNINV